MRTLRSLLKKQANHVNVSLQNVKEISVQRRSLLFIIRSVRSDIDVDLSIGIKVQSGGETSYHIARARELINELQLINKPFFSKTMQNG